MFMIKACLMSRLGLCKSVDSAACFTVQSFGATTIEVDILFDFIKWPERDMSDCKKKDIFKWSAYLLNPPRLIRFLNIHFRKGFQKKITHLFIY